MSQVSERAKRTVDDSSLIEQFQRVMGKRAEFVARAPGRVNLIGEHIDYNGGPVLPMALQREVRIAAARRRADRRVRLFSVGFDTHYEGALPAVRSEQAAWANYVLGVVDEFEKQGAQVPGFDALVDSSVPIGSGLSSSAALEVATGILLTALLDVAVEPLELALLCQRAENQFVGVQCGLMDQASSACCRQGQALLLDCSVPSCEQVTFPGERLTVVVAHSGVRRGLSASAYNERRSQCEQALEFVNQAAATPYSNLCAVPGDVFQRVSDGLPEVLLRRSRHVLSETTRVRSFVAALQDGQVDELGRLLDESHFSLRDDYEVSCPELDELTERCRRFEGVLGSRLTGAGFGGCSVTLVQPAQADTLIEYLREEYYEPRKIDSLVFTSQPAAGAVVFRLD